MQARLQIELLPAIILLYCRDYIKAAMIALYWGSKFSLSVRHTRALWRNERKYCRYFDTIWKSSQFSFWRKQRFRGLPTLPPKICGQSDQCKQEHEMMMLIIMLVGLKIIIIIIIIIMQKFITRANAHSHASIIGGSEKYIQCAENIFHLCTLYSRWVNRLH